MALTMMARSAVVIFFHDQAVLGQVESGHVLVVPIENNDVAVDQGTDFTAPSGFNARVVVEPRQVGPALNGSRVARVVHAQNGKRLGGQGDVGGQILE